MERAKNIIKLIDEICEQKVTVTVSVDTLGEPQVFASTNNVPNESPIRKRVEPEYIEPTEPIIYNKMVNFDKMNYTTTAINPADKFVIPTFGNADYINREIEILWDQFVQNNQLNLVITPISPDMIRAFTSGVSKSNFYTLDVILRWARDYFDEITKRRLFL